MMENFDDYKSEEKQELLRALQLEPGPAGDEAILCIRDHARAALWFHQQSEERPYAGDVQKAVHRFLVRMPVRLTSALIGPVGFIARVMAQSSIWPDVCGLVSRRR